MNVHQWHQETLGKRAVEALKKNNFDAIYFSHKEEAAQHILNFIQAGQKVGFGGSMTVAEMELEEKIKAKGAELLNHNAPGLTPQEKLEIRRQQLLSDVFICSTNALTLEGYLVNVDGVGNRVAAMTFGPKKVIVVAGVNKICQDVHEALKRIQLIASPKNNKRLDTANPCTTLGSCTQCQGKTRICNIYSILKRKPSATDMTVVVVGESLGY